MNRQDFALNLGKITTWTTPTEIVALFTFTQKMLSAYWLITKSNSKSANTETNASPRQHLCKTETAGHLSHSFGHTPAAATAPPPTSNPWKHLPSPRSNGSFPPVRSKALRFTLPHKALLRFPAGSTTEGPPAPSRAAARGSRAGRRAARRAAAPQPWRELPLPAPRPRPAGAGPTAGPTPAPVTFVTDAGNGNGGIV